MIAVLNALLPPLVAALRLPFMLVLGFLLVLVLDALMLLAARPRSTDGDLTVDSLLVGALASRSSRRRSASCSTSSSGRTTTTRTRSASSSGSRAAPASGSSTDVPGIVFLEIDGLALPVLQRAMRDGNAPNMARWLADGTHRLAEWETDLSSQTGASQAGILLGSNEDIPAFRWVEKETGDADDLLGAGRLRGDRAPPRRPAAGCSSTAARAAATCSPARPTT